MKRTERHDGWSRKATVGLLAIVLAGCATPSAPPARVETQPAPEAPSSLAPAEAPMKVMILIDEKSLGTIPTSEVENMATAMLLECDVQVVDQDMVRAELQKGQQMLKMAGDARGAAALGLQFGADIVLIGEAVVKPSAQRIAESNLRTYQAVVTLRGVRTDNASAVATASEDASVIGLEDVSGSSKSLKQASRKALNALVPAMLTAWAKEGGRSKKAAGAAFTPIELTVGGMDQLWKVKAVRERLEGMTAQARNVQQRNYTAGVAIFSLESALPAECLAEELVLNPPEKIRFQVLEIAPGKIQLKAAPAE